MRPRKRCRGLNDLGDEYTNWTPVPEDDLDGVHAVADTVTSFDISPDDETVKRKCYASSGWGTICSLSLVPVVAAEQVQDFSGASNAPLHCLKEWNRLHWVDVKLSGGPGSLSVVYQLGHHGMPCAFPDRERKMVVMDVTGIHTLTVRYCNCEQSRRATNGTLGQLLGNAWYPATTIDPETCTTFAVLDWLRLQNVVGNVSAHDFVGALERKMDPLHVSKVPDRYKTFARMARQYSFLLMVIRTGILHAADGLRNTKPGSLAVECWACPVGGDFVFLFMLILALNTNFRLKNRLRASEIQNPALGSGLGYFCEEKRYKNHLKNYVAESDVSTCIAFAALLQKETQMTGMGDLQKGEQYSNMDYILLSAILGILVLYLTISYDIVCQWKKYLATHAKIVEEALGSTTRLEDLNVIYALPVWHAAAHETSCQTENSLSYAEGGDTLARKPIVAITERDKQVAEFWEVDSSINKGTHLKWEQRINEWRADRENKPNPYCLAGGKGAGPTEAAILLELKTAEALEVAEGREAASNTQSTPTAFIKSGLQLEESQRRIRAEIKELPW
ncbi:hypothetical protein B0H14DRAFT_3490881 [Mycena olivaceomarginata]|nr:hypothetical protein B0H14DRAFT_3490881 [Mycena olivaceomarginata]